MDDQKLTELAANICDGKLISRNRFGDLYEIFGEQTFWSPLQDNDQALRLAVARNVQITPGITRCQAHIYGQETICIEYAGDGNGRNTALSAMPAIRRAIVLAVVGPQS